MKAFLDDHFLLNTEPARRLFHDWAKNEPILDYHNHLPPAEVADDVRFTDLAQLWLGGDHYKWRLMRANGVPEATITGAKPGRETFRAWAATVPHLLGNPLYHWTHLELKRYFGVEEVLGPDTADTIYDRVNEMLAGDGFSTNQLLVDTVQAHQGQAAERGVAHLLARHELVLHEAAKPFPTVGGLPDDLANELWMLWVHQQPGIEPVWRFLMGWLRGHGEPYF